MLFWTKNSRKRRLAAGSPPAVQVTLEDVKLGVLRYEAEMPEGINRKSLLLPDGSLDLRRLSRYLGGVSEQKFYLSRETYEIFEEEDREIPYFLDLVQVAVDVYVEETGKLPVLKPDQPHQVDYRLLQREHYLKEIPPFPLYITDQEMLLSHRPKQII
ncbi:uncharacterized protein DUF3939 [Fontibacillus phaseoli]|uniref:Uncharacterized protein DUF3939 n=1 Tax=Fontibacillus phaseoli TaxID=1416533 RepID=A0A369B962_9BACL|nr:DUF3939 domain-containing protein [Fontibacillus phaseoli]RCX17077.1 uncharacterized protein DUF3939 [Fontibacillus phaseoli]